MKFEFESHLNFLIKNMKSNQMFIAFMLRCILFEFLCDLGFKYM
jgi:hypothetical protein